MWEYFYKNLVFIALAVATFLIIKLILRKTKFKNKEVGTTLKYPLSYRLAPLCTLGFFAAVLGLAAIVGIKTHHIYVIAAGIVALGGLITALGLSLWKVEIGEDSFIYVNYFGKKKKFAYIDLEIDRPASTTKWYFYKDKIKVFTMRFFIRGGNKLASAYEDYLCKIGKAQKIVYLR